MFCFSVFLSIFYSKHRLFIFQQKTQNIKLLGIEYKALRYVFTTLHLLLASQSPILIYPLNSSHATPLEFSPNALGSPKPDCELLVAGGGWILAISVSPAFSAVPSTKVLSACLLNEKPMYHALLPILIRPSFLLPGP